MILAKLDVLYLEDNTKLANKIYYKKPQTLTHSIVCIVIDVIQNLFHNLI